MECALQERSCAWWHHRYCGNDDDIMHSWRWHVLLATQPVQYVRGTQTAAFTIVCCLCHLRRKVLWVTCWNDIFRDDRLIVS